MNSDPSIGGARMERDCMAGKAKKAALAKVASGANVLQVTQEKDKTRERLLAEVGFSPCGANVLQVTQDKDKTRERLLAEVCLAAGGAGAGAAGAGARGGAGGGRGTE